MHSSGVMTVGLAQNVPLDVGGVVDRRYRLKREIARGGAGAVFEAEHLYTGRTVAIKLLIAEHAGASESRTRLLHEARALSASRHPGIVLGLDAGETEDATPYLVMELLEGRTLEGILAVRRRVSVPDAINIGIQLCEALASAHEHGILHRDVKPSNIFISRNDEGREVAKVFDFGVAQLKSERKITQQGAVLGTPEYMAPEQLLASDEIDARCDVYALGVTLFEALASVVPFEGSFGEVLLKVSTQEVPSLTQRCPDVPPALERIIAKALARNAEERYPNMHAFAEALSRVPTGESTSLLGIKVAVPPPMPSDPHTPVRAAQPGVPPPLPQPVTRRRFARAPYVTPARIFRADGSLLDGRSEDISVGGLLVLAPRSFEQEERVKVRFALPITGKLLEVPAVARWVKMARGTGGAFGLEFSALAPEHLSVIEAYVVAMGGE